MKYMIDSVVLSGLLIRCQITRCLHYHDCLMISVRIAADWADILIRQRTALLTVTDILAGIYDCIRKSFYLFYRHIDHMKCKSLC